jgi:hypothetical protein
VFKNVALTAILLGLLCFNSFAGEDGCWDFYQPSRIIYPESLEFFTDSLPFILEKGKWLEKELLGFKDTSVLFTCEIDTIGYFNNRLVLDLFFKINYKREEGKGKAILIEQSPNEFSLLFEFFDYGFNVFDRATVIKYVKDQQIMEGKIKLGGNNSWYVKKRWVWDENNDCPCELKFGDKDNIEFDSEIPHGFSIEHGSGGFVLDSLFESGFTGKEDDHYRWKTGGRYKIWYKIEGCSLIPIKKTYNHDKKMTH